MKDHRIVTAARGLLLALALPLALAATPALAAGGGTAPGATGTPTTPSGGATPVASTPVASTPVASSPGSGSPFDGNAMWIWQLPRTERGNLAAIAARAKANNVRALYVKSADGPATTGASSRRRWSATSTRRG